MDPLGEQAIFQMALLLEPKDREAFVRGACAGDEAAARVLDLLSHAPDPHTPSEVPLSERIRMLRVRELLGEGGMGKVYRAEDPKLGTSIAIKIWSGAGFDTSAGLERFYREARIAAKLHHDGIIRIHDFGEHEGAHYILMDLVQGGSLEDRLKVLRQSPDLGIHHLRWAARLAAEVASALHAAHTHSPAVVHRDVKPPNILLSATGRTTLIDFGIAKESVQQDARLTRQDQFLGTVGYASPEQVSSNANLDERADIYALGVTLYEMLTLRRPFEGTEDAVKKATLEDDAPWIRTFNKAIPDDLAAICHRAIERDPTDRYRSAHILENELRAWLAGESPLARPPGVSRRARRWIFRHRVPLSVAAGVCLLVFALSMLLVARMQWRSQRVLVELAPPDSSSTVFFQRFDDHSLTHEPPQRLGVTPLTKLLQAGVYRFTFVGPGTAIAEIDINLNLSASERVTLTPRLIEETEATSDMAFVPSGMYPFGRDNGAPFEARRTMHLDAFYIDRREVSNADYRRYMQSTNAPEPPFWAGIGGWSEDMSEKPVVGLTVDEMRDYAAWAGKRLPTVFEWEAAARYPDGRRFPWEPGNEQHWPAPSLHDFALYLRSTDESWAELYTARARPVTNDPASPSPLMLVHLFGNVHEVTGTPLAQYNGAHIAKGGGLIETPDTWSLDRNATALPDNGRSLQIGFRCARSAHTQFTQEMNQ
jgi:serine/threonine protein kinase/formylglycine-generating enzyme required for sulfatase activity